MKIAFVASEITPFAKTGGLADVAAALPRTLHQMGHDLCVFMPLYARVRNGSFALRAVPDLQNVPLKMGEQTYHFSVLSAVMPASDLTVHLIDCPELFARSSIYTADADEHRRFIMLQRAALESMNIMEFSPEILHCNDWHTALLPLLLKTRYSNHLLFRRTRTVMSIHNIGYQGIFAASAMLDLGIDDVMGHIRHEDRSNGQINWLKEGIVQADVVSTVSPTYAHEICIPAGGYGLDTTLRARSDAVIGILNGVDYHSWNPETDNTLPARYTIDDLSGKAKCKQALLALGKLDAADDLPVVGLVSRLAHQKGIDLLMDSLPELFRNRNFALCVLGSGDPQYVEFFNQLMQEYPQRVYFRNGYDESLAHLIEAGSDMFLMPSLYEPCGLNQMYSLKYGTIPIVRNTGGLADSVQMWDGRNGTGIVFNDYDAPAVNWAMNTALDLYRQPAVWQQLIRNGMSQDFSWEKQALRYQQLYQQLLA